MVNTNRWYWGCHYITHYCSSKTGSFPPIVLICAKSQRNALFTKGSEFLHDDILEKTSRLDEIEFDLENWKWKCYVDKIYFNYTLFDYFQTDIWLDQSHRFYIQCINFWNWTFMCVFTFEFSIIKYVS